MERFKEAWASISKRRRLAIIWGVLAVLLIIMLAVGRPSSSDGGRSYQEGLEAGRTGVGHVAVEGGMSPSGACDEAEIAIFAFQEPWKGYESGEFRRGCLDGLRGR